MEVRMQIETTNKIIFFMIKKPKKTNICDN